MRVGIGLTPEWDVNIDNGQEVLCQVPQKQVIHTKRKVEPKVVIQGTGQAMHKPPITVRISKAVIAQIEELVNGPRYLAWEYVLRMGLAAIKEEPGTIKVQAETLD